MFAPVLSTVIPRTSPSVVSIAMQRTFFSPRCCATSTTRLPGLSLIDGFEIRSAVLISGSAPRELDVDDGADDLDDPALTGDLRAHVLSF